MAMQAVVYDIKPLGWLTCKWMRHLSEAVLRSKMNGFSLRTLPKPELPDRDWVRLRTVMGGICGSDLALVEQKQPADSFLAAYSSMPMILGHENVAVVEQVGPDVDRSWLGRRVVVEPTLGCGPRKTQPPCDRCEAGQFGACENFSGALGGRTQLPAGTSIGYNSRTGGSWGGFFVAHQSQLIPLPDNLADEKALLIDPMSVCLHGVLRTNLAEAGNILVYGTGAVGIGMVGCLRAMGYDGRIEILGRSEHPASLARRMGADDYLQLPSDTPSRFAQIAGRTGGTVQKGRFGNYMISGGYDVVYDCIGSARSVQECLKWTRARGQVVLLGTLQTAQLDLTPMWFRELSVIGAYGRQIEQVDGRSVNTYQLVLEMIADGRLNVNGLLTHRFRLGEYKKALAVAMHKRQHGAIKVAFDFR